MFVIDAARHAVFTLPARPLFVKCIITPILGLFVAPNWGFGAGELFRFGDRLKLWRDRDAGFCPLIERAFRARLALRMGRTDALHSRLKVAPGSLGAARDFAYFDRVSMFHDDSLGGSGVV